MVDEPTAAMATLKGHPLNTRRVGLKPETEAIPVAKVFFLELEGADDPELGLVPLGDTSVNFFEALLLRVLDDMFVEELGYPPVTEGSGDKGDLEIELGGHGTLRKRKDIVHPVHFWSAEGRIADKKPDHLFLHQGDEGFVFIPWVEVALPVIFDLRLDANGLELFRHLRLELPDQLENLIPVAAAIGPHRHPKLFIFVH